MTGDRKLHFLFAVFMAGGNSVIYSNLKTKIEPRPEFNSSWLPVDTYPSDLIGKIPPFSFNGSLRNSVVMRNRIRAFEKSGTTFDAAYYFQYTFVIFLRKYRRTVPYLLAMDGVPAWYAKHKLWYAHRAFDPASPIAKLKHVITRSVYAQAFHLLPLSEGVRDCLIEDYRIPEEKVTVVPPGIDLNKWTFVDRRPERKGIAGKPLKVLFVGADFLRKGGDLLVSLARRDEFQNVQFQFVTKESAGEERPNIFVYRDVSPNSTTLIDLYRDADVFALPTRADTHSIASLEAMASGLPVIATGVGGVSDIIDEGRSGYYVPTDSEDAIADRLRRLMAEPGLRVEMGRNGRKRVEAKFDLARHAETIIDLLIRAVHAGPSRKR